MRVYSMAFEMKASLHNINSEATCIYLPPLKIVVCLRTTFAKISYISFALLYCAHVSPALERRWFSSLVPRPHEN